MDPRRNPYSPGAGTRPPELAGRERILEEAEIAIARTVAGRHAKGQMLLGLRGVGKTVLLNRIEEIAENAGCHPVLIEAPESRALPSLLVPHRRRLLIRLDRGERRRDHVRRALRTLVSFAGAFEISIGGVEVGIDPEAGQADSGDLEVDLPDLLLAVTRAAQEVGTQEVGTAVVLMIDEVQHLSSGDLSALIVAIHKVSQRALPLLFSARVCPN